MTSALEAIPVRLNAPTLRDVMALRRWRDMIDLALNLAPERMSSDEATAVVRRAVMDLEGIIGDPGRVGK